MFRKKAKIALLIAFGSLFFTLFIVGVVHAHLLVPQSDFDYSLDYRTYQIFSDRVIDSTTLRLFDEVHRRLQFSDIAQSEARYKVFLCYDAERFARYTTKLGLSATIQGFNLQPLGYTFISMSFVEEIRNRYGKAFGYGILEGNPAHVIAHEIVHEQMGKHLGYFVDRNLAPWKREGYCEYIATKSTRVSDQHYQLDEAARRFFNGRYDDISPGRQLYISSRLLTEFLLDEKKLSPAEFFQLETASEQLLVDLRAWATTAKER